MPGEPAAVRTRAPHNNVDFRYGFLVGGSGRGPRFGRRPEQGPDRHLHDRSPTQHLTKVGAIRPGVEVYAYAMGHSWAPGRLYSSGRRAAPLCCGSSRSLVSADLRVVTGVAVLSVRACQLRWRRFSASRTSSEREVPSA